MSLTGGGHTEDAAYCADQIRLGDRDRYLSTLYAPDQSRRHLLALYALHHEISRIGDLVSEPALGEIRLQWWHDAVVDLYSGNTRDHPVLRELAKAIPAGDLQRAVFDKLMEATREDLYQNPPPFRHDLEHTAYDTDGLVILSATQILGARKTIDLIEAARDTGLALAITRALTTLSRDMVRGRARIPGDILAMANLSAVDIDPDSAKENKAAAFHEMWNWAKTTLERARSKIHHIPVTARSAFLPASVLDLYLKAMSKPQYDPWRDMPRVNVLRRQWRIMRLARKNNF